MKNIGWFLFLAACAAIPEGETIGDCDDDADNDGNGLFDCDDEGCASSPKCDETDTDTDTDTDSDTDTDTDSDTDTDTDSDTDTDTDFDGDGFTTGDDCDDADDSVNPDAEEVCGNDQDDDCDGTPGDCGFSGSSRMPEGPMLLGDKAYDMAGSAVAAGDFDGDGQMDVAVGGRNGSTNGTVSGVAYAVPGPLTGDLNLWEVDGIWPGEKESAHAGTALAVADFDGDGADELVIGAPDGWPDSQPTGDGTVYVVSAANDGGDMGSDAIAIYTPEVAAGGFGTDVAAGDVTGDGIPDVLVGSWNSPAYVRDGGAAYIFEGPATTTRADSAASRIYGTQSPVYPALGRNVAIPGDIDGDGIGEVLVNGNHQVLLFSGPAGASLMGADRDVEIASHPATRYGWPEWPGSVQGAGDVDGDGLADVLIGCYLQVTDTSSSRSGGAYLMTADQLTEDIDMFFATWKVAGANGFELGRAVTAAGDLDGDGFDDIILGAIGDYEYGTAAGAGYLWYGPLTGSETVAGADASWHGLTANGAVGSDVAVGDVTGDGLTDVVLGADWTTGGATSSGAVLVVPGSGW